MISDLYSEFEHRILSFWTSGGDHQVDLIEIEALFDALPDPNARTPQGRVPIEWVVDYLSTLKIGHALLRKMLNTGVRIPSGLIHKLVEGRDFPTAEILLGYGANPNLRNERGDTALTALFRNEHTAFKPCGKGRDGMLILLLHHGADLNIKDGEGHSPLELAMNDPEHGIVPALLKSGARLPATFVGQADLLHSAFIMGDVEDVIALIAAGLSWDLLLHDTSWLLCPAEGVLSLVDTDVNWWLKLIADENFFELPAERYDDLFRNPKLPEAIRSALKLGLG